MKIKICYLIVLIIISIILFFKLPSQNCYHIVNNNGIAGYKISVNDYNSGLFRTKEEALKRLQEVKNGLEPYPENLKYMEFITVMYER